MGDALGFDGIAQGGGHMLLADQLLKILGPPLAG
jgi:hypothetical protein